MKFFYIYEQLLVIIFWQYKKSRKQTIMEPCSWGKCQEARVSKNIIRRWTLSLCVTKKSTHNTFVYFDKANCVHRLVWNFFSFPLCSFTPRNKHKFHLQLSTMTTEKFCWERYLRMNFAVYNSDLVGASIWTPDIEKKKVLCKGWLASDDNQKLPDKLLIWPFLQIQNEISDFAGLPCLCHHSSSIDILLFHFKLYTSL